MKINVIKRLLEDEHEDLINSVTFYREKSNKEFEKIFTNIVLQRIIHKLETTTSGIFQKAFEVKKVDKHNNEDLYDYIISLDNIDLFKIYIKNNVIYTSFIKYYGENSKVIENYINPVELISEKTFFGNKKYFFTKYPKQVLDNNIDMFVTYCSFNIIKAYQLAISYSLPTKNVQFKLEYDKKRLKVFINIKNYFLDCDDTFLSSNINKDFFKIEKCFDRWRYNYYYISDNFTIEKHFSEYEYLKKKINLSDIHSYIKFYNKEINKLLKIKLASYKIEYKKYLKNKKDINDRQEEYFELLDRDEIEEYMLFYKEKK